MLFFYIDTITHLVHKKNCPWKRQIDCIFLGNFNYVYQAITEAKRRGFNKVNSCIHCCSESYTE